MKLVMKARVTALVSARRARKTTIPTGVTAWFLSRPRGSMRRRPL